MYFSLVIYMKWYPFVISYEGGLYCSLRLGRFSVFKDGIMPVPLDNDTAKEIIFIMTGFASKCYSYKRKIPSILFTRNVLKAKHPH